MSLWKQQRGSNEFYIVHSNIGQSHKINAIIAEEEQDAEEQTRHELWEPDLNYANACIEFGDGEG